ncbi:DUF4097 family beta strand repeat-containing protein [Aeromicrobium sp.]|uniref:DUF4097 family beta strand repeat-containing protein n=1 Tax=Aeromicrobium sp. TaxID=1871063 RepID=UPI0030BF6DFD
MTAEETVADYDVRSPASRTLMTVIGTIVAVVLVGGLVLGASILKRDTTVSTSVVEVGGSAQLVIDAGAADVRLVKGAEDVVRIRSRITSGLRKTEFQLGRRADEIKIAAACQAWLSPGCGVSATLEIPEGLPVVVKTTTGDVVADSIVEGVLTVTSGSGDISVRGIEVDEFSANTGSGDIRASFASQPFGFKAMTESGDIRAMVPTGERTYAITVKSDSGEVSNDLRSDRAGEGILRATTGSGDITLWSE